MRHILKLVIQRNEIPTVRKSDTRWHEIGDIRLKIFTSGLGFVNRDKTVLNSSDYFFTKRTLKWFAVPLVNLKNTPEKMQLLDIVIGDSMPNSKWDKIMIPHYLQIFLLLLLQTWISYIRWLQFMSEEAEFPFIKKLTDKIILWYSIMNIAVTMFVLIESISFSVRIRLFISPLYTRHWNFRKTASCFS